MSKKIVFSDIGELMTLKSAARKKARGGLQEADLSIEKKQVMIVEDGKITWTGSRTKIPRELRSIKKEISFKGANVFPGFIDCHTHSLFLGDRSGEFELRNQGVSYQEIANRGGGILSTVRETRKGNSREIKEKFKQRMEVFLQQGVTSVEVKSGYGLSVKDEVRLLRILKETPTTVKVIPTFLGAHALPPEYSSRESYLSDLKAALPLIAKEKLAERVDIFIEKNYFTLAEGRDYLKAAQALGFKLVIHADQLTHTGASALAVELGATSTDHAICITEQEIIKLARSETTCVLLPAADFYIHCPYPPARKLLDSGARVALSTDYNPGTSPTQNIQLVGLLARLEMKMTLPEVFIAYTLGAAYALDRGEHCGALIEGFAADFFVSEHNWRECFYDLNPLNIQSLWISGQKKV
jgi:imidazolonepropionase